jgi:hypothetical protein
MSTTPKFGLRKKKVIHRGVRQQRNWSKHQTALFNDVAGQNGHTIVLAVPGSGKSTTILEALYHVPENVRTNGKVLMAAFNSSIVEELERKSPPEIHTKTFHKIGFQAVRKNWGYTYGIGPRSIDVQGDLAEVLASEEVGDDYEARRLRKYLVRAFSLAKAELATDIKAVEDVVLNHSIPTAGISSTSFAMHVFHMMEKTLDKPLTLNGKPVISFDDMLWLPVMHGWQLEQYDRIFVDECQDLSNVRNELVLNSLASGGRLVAVGDKFQCVDKDTLISTPDGEKKITQLSVGDTVLSWRNSRVQPQTVRNIVKSDWTYGLKIITKSGKTLTMSPNHRIWVSDFELKNEQHIVYMMYRAGFGFRVGVTNKVKGESKYGQRAVSEKADKLWVLNVCDNREDALYLEQCYSLEYGIPTCVFEGLPRGLNQDRINDIFNTFGNNGTKLLADKNYHFDYPHWTATNSVAHTYQRLIISLLAHGGRNSNHVRIEWTDNGEIKKTLESDGIVVSKAKKDNRFRVRKYFQNYREAVVFANKLQSLIPGSFISEKIHTPDDCLTLVTAAGVHPGMSVAILNGDTITLDEVVSVEDVPGEFYDIDVDDASNFFGNGILSHNCIYGFAGAKSGIVDALQKKLDARILPLSVSYRLPRKVIELAKKINPQIMAADNAIDGVVDHVGIEKVESKLTNGCAVLSRANFPLVSLCFRLVKNGYKANIQGKDIGNRFLWRIGCWEPDSVLSLCKHVDKWRNEMAQLLLSKRISTSRLDDEANSILAFTAGASTVREVEDRIRKLFSDDPAQIKLSTAHKAKGLEWDNVLMMNDTFKPDKGEEESNIYYVSLTRAKQKLTFINGKV